MPKVAIFFLILLVSPILTNSHAFTFEESPLLDNSENSFFFNSNIIDIDPTFFVDNDFKRYLIFGSNLPQPDIIKNNSIYGIQSDSGFFYVSVLSTKSASNLISQGYDVIEDSQLDFHLSEKIIPDASRIGEITGSSITRSEERRVGKECRSRWSP